MEWVGGYPPVGSPYEPICGIVVDDVLYVSPRGYGLPLGVFNDVFRVGGAVFRQEGVDVVSGGYARSGWVLTVQSACPIRSVRTLTGLGARSCRTGRRSCGRR